MYYFRWIEKAKTTVIKRLNSLLDMKYLHNTKIEIPEKNDDDIKINEKFKILVTVEEKDFNRMPPTFINRFIVIYLDNQLEEAEKKI